MCVTPIPVAPLAHVETMSIAASRAARLANIVQATDDRPISLTSSKKLTFYIFGHPVTMSPSPDIHNVGFKLASQSTMEI